MRINFLNDCVPTRAAKRLKKLLSEKDALSKQITSYVLGYRNWHDLDSNLGKGIRSRLDEECSTSELQERKEYQIKRFKEKVGELNLQLNHEQIIAIFDVWQPSAGRPDFQADTSDGWDNSPEGKDFEALLVEMHKLAKFSPQDLLLKGVERTKQGFLVASACSVAKKLLTGSSEDVQFAKEIFEAASARGNYVGTFELALCLAIGSFGYTDSARAVSVFKKLVADPKAPKSAASYARVGIFNLQEGIDGWPINPMKSLREWEAASDMGDAEAAFRAAIASDPLKKSLCILSASPERSIRYYRKAAKAGHASAALNLSMQLTMHPEHEEYLLESTDWQEFAELKGDRGAQRIRKILDEKVANLTSGAKEEDLDAALEKLVYDFLPGSSFDLKIRNFSGYGDTLFIPPGHWLSLSSGVIIEDVNGAPPDLAHYFGNHGALRNEFPRPATILGQDYIKEHFPSDESRVVERLAFVAHMSQYVHELLKKEVSL
jgi:hypothetical protein